MNDQKAATTRPLVWRLTQGILVLSLISNVYSMSALRDLGMAFDGLLSANREVMAADADLKQADADLKRATARLKTEVDRCLDLVSRRSGLAPPGIDGLVTSAE